MKLWMSGFLLPEISSPVFEIEEANLAIVRDFYAVLLVCADGPIFGPSNELRRHWPQAPDFPTFGAPSGVLLATGIVRKGSAGEAVLKALRDGFDNEQASVYLALCEVE